MFTWGPRSSGVEITAFLSLLVGSGTDIVQSKPTPFTFKLVAGGSSSSSFYRATLSTQTTGKRYIEFVAVGPGATSGRASYFGFYGGTLASNPASNTIGAIVTNINYNGGSPGYYLNASGAIANGTYDFVQNDVIGMAIDHATGKVWVRKNGAAWIGGGDPAADTSPTFTMSAGTYVPVIYHYVRGGPFTGDFESRIRLANDTFGAAAPSGFSPYS